MLKRRRNLGMRSSFKVKGVLSFMAWPGVRQVHGSLTVDLSWLAHISLCPPADKPRRQGKCDRFFKQGKTGESGRDTVPAKRHRLSRNCWSGRIGQLLSRLSCRRKDEQVPSHAGSG